MRCLIILASVLCLGACTADKYSSVPEPTGEWKPANVAPDSTDNNILPDFARGVVSS